ncbi:hypothetical protein B0H13DRAFT_1851269 [Mycena leptocephala]|nr:hypothetical protein B0H13DRAFT_1851269 [Mycena leptocephala]
MYTGMVILICLLGSARPIGGCILNNIALPSGKAKSCPQALPVGRISSSAHGAEQAVHVIVKVVGLKSKTACYCKRRIKEQIPERWNFSWKLSSTGLALRQIDLLELSQPGIMAEAVTQSKNESSGPERQPGKLLEKPPLLEKTLHRTRRSVFNREQPLMELLAAEHSSGEPDDGELTGSGDDYED